MDMVLNLMEERIEIVMARHGMIPEQEHCENPESPEEASTEEAPIAESDPQATDGEETL